MSYFATFTGRLNNASPRDLEAPLGEEAGASATMEGAATANHLSADSATLSHHLVSSIACAIDHRVSSEPFSSYKQI